MVRMFSAIGERVRQTARAFSFSVLGVVFGLVGLAFLTVALWIVIATSESALVAYAVIGAIYLILGICMLVLGAQKSRTHPDGSFSHQEHADTISRKEPLVQLAEGFAIGMQAGRAVREDRN